MNSLHTFTHVYTPHKGLLSFFCGIDIYLNIYSAMRKSQGPEQVLPMHILEEKEGKD
jgi:hypothetical protein